MSLLRHRSLAIASLFLLTTASWAQSESTDPLPPSMFNDGDGGESVPAAGANSYGAWPIWNWSGYGELTYQRFDFFDNAQDTTPTRRGRLDLRRLVLEPSIRMSPKWRFQAEIEFEHGGTGSTVEFEPEEAGEFETEIEQGGEVILENAFIEFAQSPALTWRFGEMTVPVGMLNTYHRPDQYFTIDRSLAESSLIPGTWHDLGIALTGVKASTRYTLMWVRALDSTSFSGYGFVSNGSQQKLETREANDFALVASADHQPMPGVILGGSIYYGDSGGNRPRGNLGTKANVTLAEIHGRWERGALIVRGEYLMGRLQNSDQVTRANFSTFNAGELGVSRTAVGSEAKAYFIEVGYDLMTFWPQRTDRLVLFTRLDAYDTHAGTATGIVRNARYDREVVTVGINYSPNRSIVFKGELARRSNEGATASEQDYAGLAVGFRF